MSLSAPHARRGAIMLQAVFLILVLMGLASVVIDLGIARATQAWMQGAVDSASLEGLRQRERGDVSRRVATRRFAALVADGDMVLGGADAGPVQGLGPVFTTGVGGVEDPGGGLLELKGVYRPSLELNEVNVVHGDMVAGTFFSPDPNVPDPNWHAEASSYLRRDFQPAATADAPAAPALLVRTRRSNDRLGLDRQADISSAGPTLPFLFGLGSGVLSTPDPDSYDPRRDGLTLRATAIADARPALAAGAGGPLAVGMAIAGDETLTPSRRLALAFEDTTWRTEAAASETITFSVDELGNVAGLATGTTPGLLGRLLPMTPLMRVGEQYSEPAFNGRAQVNPAAQLFGLAYVALYIPDAAGPQVTGLAAIDVQQVQLAVDAGGAVTALVTATKLPALVAPENASAVPSLAADPTFVLPEDGARQLLLAPVLAR